MSLALVAMAVGQVGELRSGGISGIVRYPDGSPSAGATVSAATECKEDVHVPGAMALLTP